MARPSLSSWSRASSRSTPNPCRHSTSAWSRTAERVNPAPCRRTVLRGPGREVSGCEHPQVIGGQPRAGGSSVSRPGRRRAHGVESGPSREDEQGGHEQDGGPRRGAQRVGRGRRQSSRQPVAVVRSQEPWTTRPPPSPMPGARQTAATGSATAEADPVAAAMSRAGRPGALPATGRGSRGPGRGPAPRSRRVAIPVSSASTVLRDDARALGS